MVKTPGYAEVWSQLVRGKTMLHRETTPKRQWLNTTHLDFSLLLCDLPNREAPIQDTASLMAEEQEKNVRAIQ